MATEHNLQLFEVSLLVFIADVQVCRFSWTSVGAMLVSSSWRLEITVVVTASTVIAAGSRVLCRAAALLFSEHGFVI